MLHTPADQKEGTREPSDTDSPGTDSVASHIASPRSRNIVPGANGGPLKCAPDVYGDPFCLVDSGYVKIAKQNVQFRLSFLEKQEFFFAAISSRFLRIYARIISALLNKYTIFSHLNSCKNGHQIL